MSSRPCYYGGKCNRTDCPFLHESKSASVSRLARENKRSKKNDEVTRPDIVEVLRRQREAAALEAAEAALAGQPCAPSIGALPRDQRSFPIHPGFVYDAALDRFFERKCQRNAIASISLTNLGTMSSSATDASDSSTSRPPITEQLRGHPSKLKLSQLLHNRELCGTKGRTLSAESLAAACARRRLSFKTLERPDGLDFRLRTTTEGGALLRLFVHGLEQIGERKRDKSIIHGWATICS